jgi:hypothetical protein
VDRERTFRLVGRKVAVRLTNVEAQGVELIATLDEVRDDGIVLSEIGELGLGPTLFCPWDSLHRAVTYRRGSGHRTRSRGCGREPGTRSPTS